MAAPAARAQGMAVAGCNYVANDQIWKDHVIHEEIAAKNWPENWDFLKTDYKELVKDDFPKRERPNIVPPIRAPVVTPLEKRVTVYPSTRPVPQTSSQMIGWRSTDEKLKLERYGKYAKPKGGLVKQLNWPAEAIG